MKKRFVELRLGSHIIVHGFDTEQKKITEVVEVDEFTKKIVALSRIKSISETYILTDYAHGRWIYWEYEESYEELKEKLNA